MKYSMQCSCGDVMDREAASRNEAVEGFKKLMTQEAIDAHMADKHPGKPGMSMADAHAMIEKQVTPME